MLKIKKNAYGSPDAYQDTKIANTIITATTIRATCHPGIEGPSSTGAGPGAEAFAGVAVTGHGAQAVEFGGHPASTFGGHAQ
jgi:hypothetical protein